MRSTTLRSSLGAKNRACRNARSASPLRPSLRSRTPLAKCPLHTHARTRDEEAGPCVSVWRCCSLLLPDLDHQFNVNHNPAERYEIRDGHISLLLWIPARRTPQKRWSAAQVPMLPTRVARHALTPARDSRQLPLPHPSSIHRDLIPTWPAAAAPLSRQRLPA